MANIINVDFSNENAERLTTLCIFGDQECLTLHEGKHYEYKLDSDRYSILPISRVLTHSRISHKYEQGRIDPGNYVGLLKLELVDKITQKKVAESYIDVRSTKLNYDSEYQSMLEFIADKCADFLLQLESPVEQYFNPSNTDKEATLAQRLYFLKSILGSEDFQQAIHRVITMPNTRWRDDFRSTAISQRCKFSRYEARQLVKGARRVELPQAHYLYNKIKTVPEKIEIRDKRDSVDTPENRFVKHALSVFLETLENMIVKFDSLNTQKYPQISEEIKELINNLEETISHSVFKEISPLTILPLNSPILQRKEGYRQILRAWTLFDLAARLSWEGGDDIYAGGKRDAAFLYEYWVFFKLLDLVSRQFELTKPPVNDLIDSKNFVLKLKSGTHLIIKGFYKFSERNLRVEFSYNRTFSGGQRYPRNGSWTRQMRPDYTLSLWPAEFSQNEAEEQELITHVHFDAKYKVEKFIEVIGEESIDLQNEKQEQRRGKYKRADLLKMHAYRDAIRRSAGAYVIYPGADTSAPFCGFHEILPGLGAFSLRPGQTDDGSCHISSFLQKIVKHVCNRVAQSEQHSFHTYMIHQSKPYELHEALPERGYGSAERTIPPAEVFVLNAWHNGPEHLSWILKSGYYNFRTEDRRGALRLEESVANASYLILHGEKEYRSGAKLLRIRKQGPRVFSKEKLVEDFAYPGKASQNYYIVYDVAQLNPEDPLSKYRWDLSKLKEISSFRASALPKKGIPLNIFMKAGIIIGNT